MSVAEFCDDYMRDVEAGLARIFHEGNGNCGEQCSSKVVCEAESHSRGYGLRLRAPIWADRAAAKPFSGERVTFALLLLRGNRRHPLKGNQRRSVRERLHEISGLTLRSRPRRGARNAGEGVANFRPRPSPSMGSAGSVLPKYGDRISVNIRSDTPTTDGGHLRPTSVLLPPPSQGTGGGPGSTRGWTRRPAALPRCREPKEARRCPLYP